MKEKKRSGRPGDMGTFVVHVQHRQNSSWQGRITWVDENQTVSFRSVWEMIKLMAGAINTVSDSEESFEEAEWPKREEQQNADKT